MLVSGPLRRSPETIAEVPFELYQHHLVVTKGSIGALNGRNLLIDTGTIPSVVDGRIARKLRLKTEPSTLIAFGQQVPIQSAVFEGFRIGSLQSGPVPAVVGDLSYLKGAPIDAIVGLDVLARTNFSIDYRTRMLNFAPERSRGRSRAAGDRVAVCDGEDDHRRPAGSIAGRLRQQRSGAVQDADARRPLRCALERRQDCAVCVGRGAPAAARAAPGRPRSARVGQTASLGARPSARWVPAEHRRRRRGVGPRLPARAIRLREGRVRVEPVNRATRKSRRGRGVESRRAFPTLSRALQNGFRIGEFHHVEPSLNSVSGPAGTLRLEPKVMQVLVCLAAQAGQVVPKERLMRTVWPDTFVGDDVLTRAISELRRVFGDDVRNPRFIQTIPKSGYRLMAPVSFTSPDDNGAAIAQALEPRRCSRGTTASLRRAETDRARVRPRARLRSWKRGLATGGGPLPPFCWWVSSPSG